MSDGGLISQGIIISFGVDLTAVTAGIAELKDMLSGIVGTTAEVTDAFSGMSTEAVAGIGGVTEALAGVGVSADGVVAGIGGVDGALASVDASFASVAVSADAAVVGIGGVTAAADTYVVGMGGVTAETDVAAASMGGFAISSNAVTASTTIAKTSLDAIKFSLAAVGISAGVVAGISVKSAGDFQQSMTQLETGAGEFHSNIQMVSNGILDMAPAVGTTTQQLAAGMFNLESAGFHGADGLNDLRIAAEGAKTGNADLGATTLATATVMNDYKDKNVTAYQAVNTLIATVSDGMTHMQDLASSMHSILPTAEAVGVSLTDTSAAMATMTAHGIPAADAATYLKQTLLQIENPTSKAKDAMKAMGLNSITVAEEMKKSLPDALQMITDAAAKKFPVGSVQYTDAIATMAGGTKSLQGMLALTGANMNTFKSDAADIASKVKAGSNSVLGWSAIQQDFNFKMDQAKSTLEVVGIQIGTRLLPVLGNLMTGMSSPAFKQFATTVGNDIVNGIQGLINAITTVVGWIAQFANFLQHNQAAMITFQAILIAAAGAIAAAFIVWAVTAGLAALATLAAAWPILAIGAVIALVVAGIILAIQHWGDIVGWLKGIWAAVSSWFMGMLNGIKVWWIATWKGMSDFFIGVWNGIISGLKAAWDFIVNVIKIGALLALAVLFAPIVLMVAAFIWLYNHNYYFKALVDAIVNFFKGCFVWLQGAWQDTINWLVGAWNNTVSFATNLWNQIAGAVKTGFSAAIGFISWIWGVISGFFSNAWTNYISKPLTALWTTVSTFFSGVWNTYISKPISDLWTSLTTTIGTWATKAVDWGKNLIQGFINGIVAAANNVGAAVGGIAAKVLAFLGFHSPTKEGPGHEADIWAPNFVKMYAKGLTDGLPQIQSAVGKLSTPLALSMSNQFKYPSSSSNNAQLIAATIGQQQIIVKMPDMYVDGQKVTNALAPHQANMIRLKGDVRRH